MTKRLHSTIQLKAQLDVASHGHGMCSLARPRCRTSECRSDDRLVREYSYS